MLDNSYVSLYKNNDFIDEIIRKPFNEVVDSITELKGVVTFITNEIEKLKNKEGWIYFFQPFKKSIKNLNFISNYINQSRDVLGFNHEEKYNEWFLFFKEIETLEQKLGEDKGLIKKFNHLFKNEQDKQRKNILDMWLCAYFSKGLSITKKKRYLNLNKTLDKKIELFQKNGGKAIWEESYAVCVLPKNKYQLKGLTKEIINIGRENAKQARKEGWLFYTEEGTTELLLKQSINRAFRKKVYESYQKLNSGQRISHNNDKVLRDIVSIKQKIAQIYNKDNYAELVLSNYVLNTPKKAYDYLTTIEKELMPLVTNMKEEITQKAKQEGILKLKNWDMTYYMNKIQEEKEAESEKIDFDNYFTLDIFMKKFLTFLKDEFSLSFKEIKKELINENEIITYEVKDTVTNHFGYFIVSPFDNEYKACPSQIEMCSNEKLARNKYLPAVEYITLMLDKNVPLRKMSFNEVSVLLHEFGHALHAFYGNREDSFVNSAAVSWDLIELPSQFLEHLVYDVDFMQKMSCHFESKKRIGKKLLKKTIEQEQYFIAYSTYKEINKYYAQLWLHENFKPHSTKSPHEIVTEKMGHNGLVYNITRDAFMLYNNHMTDYAPTGYIYLYSGQIAERLIQNNKGNLKKVFTNLFNSDNIGTLESRLNSIMNLNNINMINFFKKGWDISLHGDK